MAPSSDCLEEIVASDFRLDIHFNRLDISASDEVSYEAFRRVPPHTCAPFIVRGLQRMRSWICPPSPVRG